MTEADKATMQRNVARYSDERIERELAFAAPCKGDGTESRVWAEAVEAEAAKRGIAA